MKTYSAKDIYNRTGLTRKHLLDYEESIPPVKRMDNDGQIKRGDTSYSFRGYRLYDQDGLEKLCLAAFYKELGAKPKTINEKFQSNSYDKESVLDELIKEAEDKRKKMENIILVANMFKIFSFDVMSINPFQLTGIETYAEYMREISKWIRMVDITDLKFLLVDIVPFVIDQAKDFSLEHIENNDEIGFINRLKTYSRDELGLENSISIFNILRFAFSIAGIGAFIDEHTHKGMTEYIVNIIMGYQLDGFFSEVGFDNLLIMHQKNLGHSSPEMLPAIETIMDSFNKWFGTKDFNSAIVVLNSFFVFLKHQTDVSAEYIDAIDYLIDVLKSHDKTGCSPSNDSSSE